MQPLYRHLFDSRRISLIQSVEQLPFLSHSPKLAVLRDDLNHAVVSGNKLRKLKYAIQGLMAENARGVVSFGGGHSNHLHALAYACNQLGLKSRLIVRGEEVLDTPSATLQDCQKWGADILPVSREEYRKRHLLEWQAQWLADGFKLIPEGGTAQSALKGVGEVLDKRAQDYEIIACAVGSGGTAAGLALALKPHQKLLAFPAVKDKQLPTKVAQLMASPEAFERIQWCWGFEGAGFGRFSKELEQFVVAWYQSTGVLPDPVYTAKLFDGIHKLYQQGCLRPEQKVLIYHSGGLQGWRGMKARLSAEMLACLESSL